jgi:MFS family permease
MKRTWLRHTAGGLPGDFWYLWAGTLVTRLGSLTILYLSISLVARYHFSPSFAGLTLGVAGAGSAVGAVLGGVLSDRFGHRNMLLASNLCLAALTFALAFPTTPLSSEATWLQLGKPGRRGLLGDEIHARNVSQTRSGA